MQFFQFQTILPNCVTNNFLQQGYTSYGPSSPLQCYNVKHDSIFVVLQCSQSSHAPTMLWGGSPVAGAPSTWPPPRLVGF
jgi:hypothetical protein